MALAAPAQAAGPATTIVVQLAPSTLSADGTSTSTAAATVTDAFGNPVAGDAVTFASTDSGETISSTTDNGNGTYTATLTTSTTATAATITASDTSSNPSVSGNATLTQTPGPAANISLHIAPTSIVANGTSTSTATATVTDAFGNPVAGDAVTFASTDLGETISSTTDNGNGTYTATIRSSTTAGPATITGKDLSAHPVIIADATLGQTSSGSTTSLVASPNAPVTNQPVTLVATVSSVGTAASLSGTVTFENSGTSISPVCTSERVTSASPTATCQTSFAAATAPDHLTATFIPDSNSQVAASAGAVALDVGRDSTTTFLEATTFNLTAGGDVTYVATITAAQPGQLQPSGAVTFLDGATPIASCRNQQLATAAGLATASCTMTYAMVAPHNVSAHYIGDANFSSSTSAMAQISVTNAHPLGPGTISATMQWKFFYTPVYTKVLAMVVNRAPLGAKVLVTCAGRSCPFARRATAVTRARRCPPRVHHIHSCRLRGVTRSVDLTDAFRGQRLPVGARITVEILRPGWIGKYYRFVIIPRRGPRVQIACLAPGGTRPGVGC